MTKVKSGGGSRFHIEFLNGTQKLAWSLYQQHDVLFLIGPAGTGKTFLATAFAISDVLQKSKKKIVLTRPIIEAGESLGYLPGPQPLDAKVLTPKGWTTMGEIKVGDLVVGRDGFPTKVVKTFPKGRKKVYKITTTDNTFTECCEDHLWLTQTKKDKKCNCKGSIKLTKQIMDSLLKNGKINHFIPRNEIIQFDKQSLPLSPYILGCLLGDGHLGDSVCLASKDDEIIIRVNEELGNLSGHFACEIVKNNGSINYNFRSLNLRTKKTARKVKITNLITNKISDYDSVLVASTELGIKKGTLKYRCKNNSVINNIKYEFMPLEKRWANPIKNILEDLCLLNTRSHNKFIPSIYKYSDIKDRIDILRGLMDTDGTVKNTGEASFSTISKQLAMDVIELVQSLGGRAVLRERNRIGKIGNINGRSIVSKNISYEFTISLPKNINPFYLSRKSNKFSCKYIHSVGIKSIELIGEKEVKCILVENPEHFYITDGYIVTHNTFEEKVNPYMLPFFDCLQELVQNEEQRTFVEASFELAPLAYMRGRTFKNSVCIFDEAQNATRKQLKLFLSRFSSNSKIIITGDPTQSDIGASSGLMDVMHRLETVAGVGIIPFAKELIVRHPMVAAMLSRLED